MILVELYLILIGFHIILDVGFIQFWMWAFVWPRMWAFRWLWIWAFIWPLMSPILLRISQIWLRMSNRDSQCAGEIFECPNFSWITGKFRMWYTPEFIECPVFPNFHEFLEVHSILRNFWISRFFQRSWLSGISRVPPFFRMSCFPEFATSRSKMRKMQTLEES